MTFRAQSFEILNQDLYDQGQLIDEEDQAGFDPEIQNNIEVFSQKTFDLDELYLDENGNAILCTNDGLNFILPQNGNQIKHIHQLQQCCIKSCCFDERNPKEQISTIIFGTQRNLDMITLIIATTTKSIYQFHVTISAEYLQKNNMYNESNLFIPIEDIFFKHYSSIEKIKDAELPQQNSVRSLINVCYDKAERPTSYLFTNGNALLLIQLPNDTEQIDNFKLKSFTFLNQSIDNNLQQQNLRMQTPPQQIALTLYHYFILIKNNLYIFSRITQKVVHTIKFKNSKDGMMKDIKNDCIWVFGSLSLDKIDLDNEDNDVWRVYLEAKRYSEAYQLCISSQDGYSQLLLKSMEDANCLKVTEDYLQEYLEKNKYTQNWECQIQIILAWVLQLKVEQIQTCKTAIYQLEKTKNKEISKQQNQSQILQKSLEKENLYEVIVHHINEEHYQTAIKYLKKVETNQQAQIIYTYSHLFLKHETEAIFEILTTKIKYFDAQKLISSLFDIPKEKWEYGVKILEHSIQKQKCQDKSVHNTYLFFLAELKKEEQINKYLEKQKQLYNKYFKILFTDVFALKICQANHLYSSQIQIFGFMKLYSDAVNLALQNDLLEDAKEIAKEVLDDVLRKKLWMEIVFYMIKNKDRFSIEEIVSLTDSESDQIEDTYANGVKKKTFLKIDEIIPHLDENMKIEQLQGKIQSSLQQYNDEIKELKDMMEAYSTQTDNCQKELIFMDEQYFIIDQNIKCELCGQYIFQEEKQNMYIFPCVHKFHQDCYFKILQQFFNLRPEFKEVVKELKNLNQDINLIKQRKQQKIKIWHQKLKNQQTELSFFEKYFQHNEEIIDTSQLNINKIKQNPSSLKISQNNSNLRSTSVAQNSNNSNLKNGLNSNITNNSSLKEQQEQFQKQLLNQAIQMGVQDYEQDGEDQELDNKLKEIFQVKQQLETDICKECIFCGEIQVDLAFTDFDKKEELSWNLETPTH
ncbi:hypothetical protein PPERSA_07738 [Pseudocohnilembus persalinus]|uniref:Pep3/Vps18 beta-propeller domain-containing protein n=1 Tax=Pseudocohnilembus persalinus TaxID=266149 RepID=A0A0V0R9N0_PSEPJ|nr:hypothetical protein PPERSA_07738 [Pseudocohnilembus persalinus]|eukprot:KRX11213.1 hypothetical protein PPERSA_07738 [Pseudocohnilembus persalinus]